MNRQSIYIIGPMRGKRYYNYPAFDAVALLLERQGWRVVNPADITRAHGFNPTKLQPDYDWDARPPIDMRATLIENVAAMLACDAVFCMIGWRQSQCGNAERRLAEAAGLRVIEEEFHEIE